jgi:hypothetical protein
LKNARLPCGRKPIVPICARKDYLTKAGEADLVRLVGGFGADGKEHIPLQAADTAMWHIRRARSGKVDQDDWRRLRVMFDERTHTFNEVPVEGVEQIAHRWQERLRRAAQGED